MAVGKTIVTATAASGVSATCEVTVIPTPAASVSLNRTAVTLEVAESVDLVAAVLPESTTDKSVVWSSSNTDIATVDENGKVVAVAVGQTIVTATAASGISATCEVTVVPDKVDVGSVQVTVSDEKIREGNVLTTSANDPFGGYANGWAYSWTLDGEVVSNELNFGIRMAMPSGTEKATASHTLKLHATNVAPDGTVWGEGDSQSLSVTVYRRPRTPQQLLVKGNGASKTLIIMMEPDDSELARLGYSYVYGYTDEAGIDHTIAITPKRFCQVSAGVFDKTLYKKWCYATWVYDDGSTVTSGKRFLDGSADEDFDASDFSNVVKSVPHKYSDPANWISPAEGGVSVNVDAVSDTRIEIYTLSGVRVKTETVAAGAFGHLDINSGEFERGTYIVSVASAGERVSRKVIIR